MWTVKFCNRMEKKTLVLRERTGDSRTGQVGSVWYQIPVRPPVGEPRAPESLLKCGIMRRGRVGVAYVGAKRVPPAAPARLLH